MAVLGILGNIVLFVAFIGLIAFVGIFAMALVITWWPIVGGISLGVILLINGHDNIAVLVFLVSIVAQCLWASRIGMFSGVHSDPMADKRRHYDTKGNIRGYSDRD